MRCLLHDWLGESAKVFSAPPKPNKYEINARASKPTKKSLYIVIMGRNYVNSCGTHPVSKLSGKLGKTLGLLMFVSLCVCGYNQCRFKIVFFFFLINKKDKLLLYTLLPNYSKTCLFWVLLMQNTGKLDDKRATD